MGIHVSACTGDITVIAVDAIVNPAHANLAGGSGIDGAIHQAAGLQLLAECRGLGGCPTGEARITRGYRLPASYVIHTVGPVWLGGQYGEADDLGRCYDACLALAEQYGIRSLAIPEFGAGLYGFPAVDAALIAIAAVRRYSRVRPHSCIEHITFVCSAEWLYQIYQRALNNDLAFLASGIASIDVTLLELSHTLL